MKEQIKYVDGPVQGAVFKHDQFFHNMRHRAEGGRQQKDGGNDED